MFLAATGWADARQRRLGEAQKNGWVYRHAFPDIAEVMLRVLTDEGARLIAAYEAGHLQPPAGVAPADYWWSLAEAHSQVFTHRITIPGRPL